MSTRQRFVADMLLLPAYTDAVIVSRIQTFTYPTAGGPSFETDPDLAGKRCFDFLSRGKIWRRIMGL